MADIEMPGPDDAATKADTSSFEMTDLEEALSGEGRETMIPSLVSRLAHLGGSIDARVRAGLTPSDFERARAIKGSIEIAKSFLLTLMPGEAGVRR